MFSQTLPLPRRWIGALCLTCNQKPLHAHLHEKYLQTVSGRESALGRSSAALHHQSGMFKELRLRFCDEKRQCTFYMCFCFPILIFYVSYSEKNKLESHPPNSKHKMSHSCNALWYIILSNCGCRNQSLYASSLMDFCLHGGGTWVLNVSFRSDNKSWHLLLMF